MFFGTVKTEFAQVSQKNRAYSKTEWLEGEEAEDSCGLSLQGNTQQHPCVNQLGIVVINKWLGITSSVNPFWS